MSPSPDNDDSLDQYWDALVADAADVPRAEHSGNDARFVQLLNDLNDARLLLAEDSTIRAEDGDTNRFSPSGTQVEVGNEIDGYLLTRVVGRGGMGVVYAAEQVALGREVALKLIRTGPLATPEDLARFQAEASATAGLSHPGIVNVIDSGSWQGHHYFSMQLINGPTLRDVFAEGPIEPQKAARYLRKISDALQHAHDHNLLHRDIKPSNVILDQETDEPCVTDFGLAKLFVPDSETSAAYEWTKTGAMVGTPSYMSPEQALGLSKHVSPASDVYSIGAVLYEALTGRAPFRAATPVETMRQVVDAEPAAPRALNSDVSRDLETICLKCLSKKPEARYQSAGELRDELDRFIGGRPILARPVGNVTKAWRWCQRNPSLAGSLVLVGTLILCGGAAHNFRLSREIANTKAAESQATENLVEAQEAQKQAERDYSRAAQAVERMLYTLGAVDLADLPKGGELRIELLQESADLQRQFAEDHPNDPQRITKLIDAEQRLAEVLYDQGKIDEAGDIIKTAVDRVDQFPGERDAALNEAELVTKNKYANWFFAQGRYPEAIEIVKSTIVRTEELCEEDPENRVTWLTNLAQNASNLANLSKNADEKEDYANRAINTFLEVSKLDGDDFKSAIGLPVVRAQLAIAIQHSDPPRSAEVYKTAEAELKALLDLYPTKVVLKQRLGENHYNLAVLQKRVGDLEAALQSLRDSIAIREEVYRDFPNKVIDAAYLGGTYGAVGDIYVRQQELEAAAKQYSIGMEKLNQLLVENPDSFVAKDMLFPVLVSQGTTLIQLERHEESLSALEAAKVLVEEMGDRLYGRKDHSMVELLCGEARYALGEHERGLAEMASAIERAEREAKSESFSNAKLQLRSVYLQYLTSLGRLRLDNVAKRAINEAAQADLLEDAADYVAAVACGSFCQERFHHLATESGTTNADNLDSVGDSNEFAVADSELLDWFDLEAARLLQSSFTAGYDSDEALEQQEQLMSLVRLKKSGELAAVMEQLQVAKPLSD